MNPATATRPEIREFVRERYERRAAIEKAGGNARHAEIDQQDELAALVAGLADDQRDRFLCMYTEEASAHMSAAIQAESEKFIADMRKEREGHKAVAWALIAIVAVLVITYWIRK
ncbi:hypothetical protein [Pseudomonas sp.]|uniref:hypothetical protein n=1 Tax=Pseudomonas sp. TaxID=306 RepID=UPI0028A84E80|nr:hypothetical protein [Pseudomonas sp.]